MYGEIEFIFNKSIGLEIDSQLVLMVFKNSLMVPWSIRN